MMQQSDMSPSLLSVLIPLYGQREANNILRIIFPQLTSLSESDFKQVLLRLAASEPWQYVIGKEWFYDMELKVTKDTLIPRPETEELVSLVLKNHSKSPLRLLDIGTGSGCIPIALKKQSPLWQVLACDISEAALEIAKFNAVHHQVEIEFYIENILAPTQSLEPLDVIISNPPYIPLGEKTLMSNNVLDYEPHLALFVEDEDPLIFYRAIGNFAIYHLKPGGRLYFELNEFYAKPILELIESFHFKDVQLIEDFYGKLRILKAIK
ncbi:MAG: peptide chain release factor N(5)-glutamine methyltransferase [Chitinophagales bacterium]|nr:peptide chain release factor N(5)-glutamine methyltransferase [Chitinophagales bacterium]MCZ2394736.1 peptide chain release factor N(5)-glutamine methyltransferase [Chitinophagales bacterium]